MGFVGLRAKLYSIKMLDGKEDNKYNGVKKAVAKSTHQDYLNCLFSRKNKMRSMNLLKSDGHEIFGVTINKIALSANDDKRFILPDGTHTLAWGIYKI